MATEKAATSTDHGPAVTPPGRRLHPSDRRAEIIKAARGVFLETGYAGAGLAEVAAAGHISRGSIYRYFPNGRVDLFVAVTEDLIDELHGRLRYAASVPFSAVKRMEHLIASMFAFFQEEPHAYRFLFRDVWASGEPAVEATAAAARGLLSSEIAGLVAESGAGGEELTASSSAILGGVLANIELALGGEVDPEVAWSVSCRFATVAFDRS
ncbi:MAG: TetR/AcrR family transcriptional regulator [Acidimicrobiales bacterium]